MRGQQEGCREELERPVGMAGSEEVKAAGPSDSVCKSRPTRPLCPRGPHAPGRLMVSCGEWKTCMGVGQLGSFSPGAAAQMMVRLRDWGTP